MKKSGAFFFFFFFFWGGGGGLYPRGDPDHSETLIGSKLDQEPSSDLVFS